MLFKKIYIHHYYSKILFYKLAHNTTDKVFKLENEKRGSVFCKYNGCDFEFIFNPELNDNDDGLHLIDFFSTLFQRNYDNKFHNIIITNAEDTPIIERIADLISNKNNWIVTFFRTERILTDYDKFTTWPSYQSLNVLQSQVDRLSNHKIISDNFFLNESIHFKYPNIYYAFSNTIWQWNEIIGIRWYYEFKQIFEKLNFDYDLMYSVRNHKLHRLEILKGLSKLNNDKILIQRTNSMDNTNEYKEFNLELESIPNVKLNSIYGEMDFDNITTIDYHRGISYDLFFRLFSKAKVQVLDESWAWSTEKFQNQYLSEKTIGIVLMNIPFISTHIYPIDFLTKLLDLPPHPFYNEIKQHSGIPHLFVEFVETFMSNFDENYLLIKEWTYQCHQKFVSKLNSNNDLLDMILDDFKNHNDLIKTNTKLF
jgi:hypothetical protein